MLITPRDSNLIAYVCSSKEVDVTHLAALFFSRDPQTGRENRKPRVAALRRLSTLRDAGFVTVAGARIRVTAKGASHVYGAVSDACAVTLRAHHDGTLAAVEHYRRYLPHGTSITDVILENKVRQQRMRGRGVANTKIGSLPDAVVNVRAQDGTTRKVALEYVSTKYTNAMIEGKLNGFRGSYDDIVFYADTPATAARVTLVTGMDCRCS